MNAPHDSMLDRTFHALRQELATLVGIPVHRITWRSRLAALIPAAQRRRVWRALQDAGFALPELGLSGPVLLVSSLLVLGPVLLLALSLDNLAILLSLIELTWLAWRLTRPLAIHPPQGYTMEEAVVQITLFTHEDYRAGRWPKEDIAAKVRMVVAEATGTPYRDITDETKICDIAC